MIRHGADAWFPAHGIRDSPESRRRLRADTAAVSKTRGPVAPKARRTQGPKRRDGSRDRAAKNGKASTPHARRPTEARRFSRTQLLIGVVVAAALVVTALLLVNRLGGSDDTSSNGPVAGAQENTAMLAGIPQRGNVLGSPKAPVTLVEYADLQCPYCATFAVDVLPYLLDDYVRTGKVKLEFRGMAGSSVLNPRPRSAPSPPPGSRTTSGASPTCCT